ncbi:MAG: thiamine pyrophosphate-dependent enzyme [Terriglobales bacterium]
MVTKRKNRSKAPSRGKTTARKTLTSAPAQPANGSGSPSSNLDMLRRMYSAMLKCRMMEERADDGARVAYDPAIGHEAVVVGTSIDLKPEDTIAASHRNFAARIAMGTALKHLLKEANANDSDDCRVAIISCQWALPGPISSAAFLADPFNLATGLALSHKLEKKTNVVVAFWDEDAAALEASHEALKFAGIHKLPIIYVTRSAGLDDPGHRKHSALEEFSFLAKDYGFPSILVDGKDVVAVWRAAQESIHRARNGSGPTLIECQTEPANFKDPLAHMQHYMTRRGAWDEGWRQQVVDQINAEIGEAMRLR